MKTFLALNCILHLNPILTNVVTSMIWYCQGYNSLETHAPLCAKTILIRPVAPWYNEDIREQKSLRRCKERRWRKSGLQIDKQAYVNQCINVKNAICKARMEYYSSIVQEAGTDSRRLFQTVNCFLHRKPAKVYLASDSSSKLANQFAYFFNHKIYKIKDGLYSSSSSNTLFFSQLDNPDLTVVWISSLPRQLKNYLISWKSLN